MRSAWQTITSKRTLALIVVSIYLLSALFGVSLGMQSDMQGNMSNCPFAQQASMCSMNLLEHITKWQQLFTAVFLKSDTLTSVLLLLLTLIALIVLVHKSHRIFSARALSPPIARINPSAQLFNYFVITFSEGILHPKIYA